MNIMIRNLAMYGMIFNTILKAAILEGLLVGIFFFFFSHVQQYLLLLCSFSIRNLFFFE